MSGKITRQELAPDLRAELDDVKNYIDATDALRLGEHIANKNNPHDVTKAQVGLGNVDNVKQATKSEFDAHVNERNPHGTLSSDVGAPPTSRQIIAGTGLTGGGTLASNRTISLDTSYTDNRYFRRTGGTLNGFLSTSSYVRASNVYSNVIEDNSNSSTTRHMYIRPTSGNEVRITRVGTSSTWEGLRAKEFRNANNNPAYHKNENIRWGTANPSGGSSGDIYIQY